MARARARWARMMLCFLASVLSLRNLIRIATRILRIERAGHRPLLCKPMIIFIFLVCQSAGGRMADRLTSCERFLERQLTMEADDYEYHLTVGGQGSLFADPTEAKTISTKRERAIAGQWPRPIWPISG